MRDLHPDFEAEIEKGEIFPAQLIACEFEPEAAYYWGGLGSLEYGGKTYLGIDRGGIAESIPETGEIQARSVRLKLFLKKDGEDMGWLRNLRARGKTVTITDVLLSEEGAIIAADTAFKGSAGDLALRVGPRAYELSVTASNELEGLKQQWGATHAESDQRRLHDGDTSGRFLPFFQDLNYRI